MHNDSTDQRSGPRARPWRVLILDRSDRSDVKWVLATVVSRADVRPASTVTESPDEVTTAWAAGQGTLTPLPRVLAWRIDR